jgi:hypothetical protein
LASGGKPPLKTQTGDQASIFRRLRAARYGEKQKARTRPGFSVPIVWVVTVNR